MTGGVDTPKQKQKAKTFIEDSSYMEDHRYDSLSKSLRGAQGLSQDMGAFTLTTSANAPQAMAMMANQVIL